MKKFKNLSDYYDYIDKSLKKAMKDIGEEVKLELQDYIWENWYKTYNPKEYERTFDFLNCVTFNVGKSNGKYVAIVYYDTSKIKAEYNEYSYWNNHMSLSGEDVSEYIPRWIEKGQKSHVYSYNGVEPIRNIVKWCEENYKEKLKSYLNGYGLKIQ